MTHKKFYAENKRLTNTNFTKTMGRTRVLQRGNQVLPHQRHLSFALVKNIDSSKPSHGATVKRSKLVL